MPIANLEYVDRAIALVEQAKERQLELRILGSLAYRLHCPGSLELFEEMERDLTDVDFAARSDQRKAVRDFFEDLGYRIDHDLVVATEGKRYFLTDPRSGMGVDVFFDELFFCHRIPLRDRLGLDYPTIPLADLVLEKMQIVEINLKDIKDSLVLLLEHPVGDPSAGRENINLDYILNIMARDWGFYYTFTTNLKKLKEFMPEFASLKGEQRQVIAGRVDHLLGTIEAAPKSMGWRLRAKVGTRKKWYQEVSEKGEMF